MTTPRVLFTFVLFGALSTSAHAGKAGDAVKARSARAGVVASAAGGAIFRLGNNVGSAGLMAIGATVAGVPTAGTTARSTRANYREAIASGARRGFATGLRAFGRGTRDAVAVNAATAVGGAMVLEGDSTGLVYGGMAAVAGGTGAQQLDGRNAGILEGRGQK